VLVNTVYLILDPQSDGWEKIRLIFGLAELSRKLKTSAKIRLYTKILRLKFSWLQTISTELLNLNWNDCQRAWLLSASWMLQNLHPSVITRSFEITRTIHFKQHDSHFIIRISVFWGGFSADKNSAANSAIGGGLRSTRYEGIINYSTNFWRKRVFHLELKYHCAALFFLYCIVLLMRLKTRL